MMAPGTSTPATSGWKIASSSWRAAKYHGAFSGFGVTCGLATSRSGASNNTAMIITAALIEGATLFAVVVALVLVFSPLLERFYIISPEGALWVVGALALAIGLMSATQDIAIDGYMVENLRDEERGVVWEEIMIYLPPRIPLLMLSATIGNAGEIAWGRIRTADADDHHISHKLDLS